MPLSPLLPVIDAGLPTGIIEPFAKRIASCGQGRLERNSLTNLQVNLGKLCNQTCTHCHVEAGPTKKRENMSRQTAQRVLELADRCKALETVDLTGGAPEMNPNFRDMAVHFRSRGLRVIDRCNLTILTEPGHEDLAQFLADNKIDIVASLPCYIEDNVDGQRGNGVFQRSIAGLKMLNELGYGDELRLDLVFNPTGPTLPPNQADLEADYHREMKARYDITFNSLLCITNIPIKRYAKYLSKKGVLDDYMRLLSDHFNAKAASEVMCRSMLSIGWEGSLFDCDFNQMLEMPVGAQQPTTLWDIESFDDFVNRPIAVADHCYGCTAGAGSSCGGAIEN